MHANSGARQSFPVPLKNKFIPNIFNEFYEWIVVALLFDIYYFFAKYIKHDVTDKITSYAIRVLTAWRIIEICALLVQLL